MLHVCTELKQEIGCEEYLEYIKGALPRSWVGMLRRPQECQNFLSGLHIIYKEPDENVLLQYHTTFRDHFLLSEASSYSRHI